MFDKNSFASLVKPPSIYVDGYGLQIGGKRINYDPLNMIRYYKSKMIMMVDNADQSLEIVAIEN